MKNTFVCFLLCLAFLSCTKIDVFEKNVAFKTHDWPGAVKPTVTFEISDTSALYNVYIVFRHADAYHYSNVWIRCTVTDPSSIRKTQQYELPLATNEGWNVPGMDDIFEHRILIQQNTKFNQPGDYHFTFQQVMREDPLENVLNIGLRIEKAGQ